MRYSVRALTPQNRIAEYVVEASDLLAARAVATKRGDEPIAVAAASAGAWTGTRGQGAFQLLLFSQELHALLAAGLTLVEAIEALAEKQSNPAQKSILENLHQSLRGGLSFSASLRERGDVFPPLFIDLMQAAEGTSDLPRALSRYVEYRQRAERLRQRLITAAIYPAILLVVGSAVIAFLVMYVVPRFATVYRGTGRDLPQVTALMLEAGRWMAENPGSTAIAALSASLALAWGLRYLIRSGLGFELLMRLPTLGEQVRTFALSRQYMTLGLLLQGGIAIVPAMRTVAESAGASVRSAIEQASERIRRGESVSDAFEAERLTTPISLRLMRVGERTGDLGGMLRQAAEFYDGDTTRFIERLSSAVEPLLMVGIGLVVGVIVVLLYMPIFDLAGSLG